MTEFLTTFNTEHPLLWALLVFGVVATTSLALYLFWELLLRLISLFGSYKNSHLKGLS